MALRLSLAPSGTGPMDGFPTLPVSSGESTPVRLDELLVDLAERSRETRFRVAPNPCVGAAVLSQEVEIGRGFHAEWGGPHAEVHALSSAGSSGLARERWDTVVVTLEPCSSQGKTPACVDALLEAGVRRVVVGAVDPDSRHQGRGIEALREAGVEVELMQVTPLNHFAPHFLRWLQPERVRRPRPWTIAKWAQTRTGQLTPPADVGDGRWISGPDSLAEVHHMRRRCDAIVTGIGTVREDDPRLTVRRPAVTDNPPIRVVLDTELSLSPDARLFAPPAEGECAGEVHVFCRPGASPARHRALEKRGAKVTSVRIGDDGKLSLRQVSRELWNLGARRVLLEAGPTLLDAWFQSALVDQVAGYTGAVNGGRGPSLAQWLEPRRLEDNMWRDVGPDTVLEAFVRPTK